MKDRSMLGGLLVSLAFSAVAGGIDITSSDETGGLSPEGLANLITTGSDVTLVPGSASVTIRNEDAFTGDRESHPKAMGDFENGITPAGAPLPTPNGGPAATYAGGIEIDQGVCLCTGVVSDTDNLNVPLPSPADGYGIGMEGPSNGVSIPDIFGNPIRNPGEASTILFDRLSVANIRDEDWADAVLGETPGSRPFMWEGSGDPTVLQFDVELADPGILRVSTVFGTDEDPDYLLQEFNDSFAVLVKKASADPSEYENIAELVSNGVRGPFSVQSVQGCPLWFKNQVPSEPNVPRYRLDNTDHRQAAGTPFYNIEFGGFSSRITWETSNALAPGRYTIKFVVHDAGDREVDAGLFIESGSIKVLEFLRADFDLDGDVDGNDFTIMVRNFNQPGEFEFTDGDATGDGMVNTPDYQAWIATFGQTGGNADARADFDRSGCVDGADLLILQRNFGQFPTCATRFHGDANSDGKVDGADQTIFNAEFGIGCGGGSQQAATGGGPSTELTTASAQASNGASAEALTPKEAESFDPFEEVDFDGDDEITEEEIMRYRSEVLGL